MVIITGASSGIGAELARLFAARKQNLLLVARREHQLELLADELRQAHAVEVEVLAVDLAQTDAVGRLCACVGGRSVEVLVNNAGLGTVSLFTDSEPARVEAMLNLNIRAVTELCRTLGASMARVGRGKILNVGSVAGFVPGPYQAVYYASKAYVMSLSKSIRYELAPAGVQVCCLCPGPTASEFHERAGMRSKGLFRKLFMMSSRQVAEAALVGLDRNQAVILPAWKHLVLGTFSRWLPDSLTARISARSGR